MTSKQSDGAPPNTDPSLPLDSQWLQLPTSVGYVYLAPFDVQCVWDLASEHRGKNVLQRCRLQLRSGPTHAPQVFEIELPSVEVVQRLETMRERIDHEREDMERGRQERLALQQAVAAAWGLIANVNGGDWTQQNDEWKGDALAWRNAYVMPEMAEPSDGAG